MNIAFGVYGLFGGLFLSFSVIRSGYGYQNIGKPGGAALTLLLTGFAVSVITNHVEWWYGGTCIGLISMILPLVCNNIPD